MGWKSFKRFILGCCGAPRNNNYIQSDSENLPDDLRDPRNQALLPTQKSGCRGSYIIHANGQVEELLEDHTGALSAYSDTETLENTRHNSSAQSSYTINEAADAELLESNRRLFWGTYEQRILADALADDKSSSEGSKDDDDTSPLDSSPHPQSDQQSSICNKLAKFSMQTSSEEDSNTLSDESADHDSGDHEVGGDHPIHHPHRPILVATRRTKLQNSVEIPAVPPKLPSDTGEGRSTPGNSPSDATPPGTPVNVKKESSPESISDTEPTSGQMRSSPLHDLKYPTLSENPKEFANLVKFVTTELQAHLNSLGRKVKRDHRCDDGCLWSLLFPRDDPHDSAAIAKVHPVVIRQLPLPQRAPMSYFRRGPHAVPPTPKVRHDASGSNNEHDEQ